MSSGSYLVIDLKADDFLLIVDVAEMVGIVLLLSSRGLTTLEDLLSCFLGGTMYTSMALTVPSSF